MRFLTEAWHNPTDPIPIDIKHSEAPVSVELQHLGLRLVVASELVGGDRPDEPCHKGYHRRGSHGCLLFESAPCTEQLPRLLEIQFKYRDAC